MASTGYSSILDRLPIIDSMGADALTNARTAAVNRANAAQNNSGNSYASYDYSAPVNATGKRQSILNYAQQFIGTPYKWGGADPNGFDCSGLVQYALGHNGINIARTSQQQWRYGKKTSIGNLRPGDLVGWDEGGRTGVGHIAFYMGNGRILEAPHTGSNVRIRNLSSSGFDKNAFGVSMNY